MLRRGQLAVLRSEPYRTGKEGESVVDVGGYDGVVGTMWMIVREEGDRNEGGDRDQLDGVERRQRKLMLKRGQGVKGLWRGWRVGMWGLVGMYGAAAMGGIGGGGGEF